MNQHFVTCSCEIPKMIFLKSAAVDEPTAKDKECERGIRIAAPLIPQTDHYRNKEARRVHSQPPALLAAPY